MPASLEHVHPGTPMGANLIAGGATFRAWAPNARAVHVIGAFNGGKPAPDNCLNEVGGGHWAGFVPGVQDRDRYMFHVVGEGSEGPKRDPYARELEAPFPAGCIVRETDFPWQAEDFATPPFHEMVIYQLHVGTFYTPRFPRTGTFLDAALKVPYLAELGVTAVQLMPIQEFQTPSSMGYNGTDYFSPEMDFAVADADLAGYAEQLAERMRAMGRPPYDAEHLRGEMNQLKLLVDVCHLHGLAVLLDVVYNHAGGDFGDESMYFFDRQPAEGGNGNSLYFTSVGHAGGLVFDFARPEVREFLIQNARFFLDEYRVDGFRYDQVSVIDHDGAPHGWTFCQDLTSTLRFHRPSALHKAEYWGVNPWIVKPAAEGGGGFDTSLTDGLRIAVRDVVREASYPDERPLAMRRLAESLWPAGFREHWQFVQGPENHDIVFLGREPRIARLGHPDDPGSWYGRSRARVATGLSLTAPGIPMLFMGQEFLETDPWSDSIATQPHLLLSWQALEQGGRHMHDHLRFVRELLALRRREPALRGQGFRSVWASDEDRVLAFHRWVPGEGRDVMVVMHMGNASRSGYRIGFPGGGEWREVFNSDVYEQWVNPGVAGNGGRVFAEAGGLHGFAHAAALTLPANGILVFAR